MTAAKAAQGLRDLADWIEEHGTSDYSASQAGNGYYLSDTAYTHLFWSVESKEAMANAVRAMGNGAKRELGDDLHVEREFGPFVLSAYTARENVCERVVVGTKVIPETVIPARDETVIEEHVEEIVEWKCAPILAPAEDVAA